MWLEIYILAVFVLGSVWMRDSPAFKEIEIFMAVLIGIMYGWFRIILHMENLIIMFLGGLIMMLSIPLTGWVVGRLEKIKDSQLATRAGDMNS